jgi:hypothetical protein
MKTGTILDKIEIEPASGRTFVRLQKLVTNGDQIITREPHRFAIEPQEHAAHIAGIDDLFRIVNAHLGSMGYPEMGVDDMAKIKNVAASAAVP